MRPTLPYTNDKDQYANDNPLHKEKDDMKQETKVRTSRRPSATRVAAAGLVLGSLALVGGASASASTSHATKELVISTVKTAKYGTILVSGHTVYTLTPNAVKCTSKCLSAWNEVLLPKGVTHATAGPGVSAAKLGTVKGAGGKLQVTYAGKALYFFFLDKAPGQVKGNIKDTWGKWSVVVTVGAPGGTTTTTAGGGGGGVGF
jgi:predicted lipoprotein with Yx(FWY)xxD motif